MRTEALSVLPKGRYSLYTGESPVAEARAVFDEIPGELRTRRITLNYVDSARIVDLSQRPEYSPIISIFQLKRSGEQSLVCYTQRLFVSNPFLESLEQFLREKAIDVPADNEERPPVEFRSYYDTDFTLIPVDIERVDITKINPAGRFRVIEHQGTVDLFRGVDVKAGFTLRMIEPTILENKLQEIEQDASYTASIIDGPEEGRKVWFHEDKQGRDHYLFKRE